jgi:N utilization substance protein B|tara:strand:+ start:8741 stop:9151 length:411 start_codon:yes stop_codon:yes gene_type:complete
MKNLANHKIAIRSREYLVQAIYQLFFNEQDIEDIIDQFKDEHKTKKVDFQLFSSSLKSIQTNRAQLKDILDDLGVNDPDMDLIDKAIFYFALNEMTFGVLDKPIVIDESIRLAKKFSSPDSYKFINANLDKVINTK